MNTQQAVDIVEIQSLLAGYVFACDEKDFDALDGIFTPDAKLTYVIEEGREISGRYPDVKDWVRRTLECFPMTQHLIGLPQIVVDGDRARASSMLFNPMQLRRESGDQLFFIGGTYRDILVRTDAGWRITERVESGTWQRNAPTDWSAPEFVASIKPRQA